MECTCIRHTELPHTTKLFADYAYHFDRVRSFYPLNPTDFESYRTAASRVNLSDDRRAALVNALRLKNGDGESLRLLAQPGTVAVVTGQQVGLFSGPAYTIYKALTAVKLARQLTARGIPAVPVFWLATEDHDFAEISRAWAFDRSNRPVPFDANGAVGTGGPVGEIMLSDLPLADLRHALSELPFGAEIVDMVAAAYHPGSTFGAAFSDLLKSLLPSYGLLHIDPMQPEIRALAAPVIRKVLSEADALTAGLLERNQQLANAGYHAQVHVEEQTSLVFVLENGRRIALKRKNGDYLGGGRSYSAADLMGMAEHLSPNALLRPVVQDSMIPTVAYVGGPAELAYLAQSQVIYQDVLGRMPVAVPRFGCTLFDQRGAKLMKKYRLITQDFFHGEDFVRDKVAAALVPEAVAKSMADARTAAVLSLERLSSDLASFDPTLQAALVTSRRKIEHQLSKIEHKIRREAIVRDERAARDSAYLTGLIYPEKHLQERLYSIIPFIARHGLALLDHVYENIQLDCPDHRLLVV